MSKRIALFCALLGVLAFVAAPAYAEVQNIKVSGDITAMGVYRNNYDLEDGRNLPGGWPYDCAEYEAEDADSFFMSIVRLRVDADLTDNVSTCIRLANIRDWDADNNNWSANITGSEVNTVDNTDEASIILDLAYVTLKEMLYSPLTLVIGRQELNYGNALIVGNGRFRDPNNSIEYNDLSTLHGYDAVRAILDYDPWTLDLVVAKIIETDDDVVTPTNQSRDSDTDLYGVNLGYVFDQYDAEMEGYFFAKRDENFNLDLDNTAAYSESLFNESKVYTVGLRGSVVPMENLTLNGEVAGQFGKIYGNLDVVSSGTLNRDREAMMANVAGEYDFADVRFNPVVGVEYLYLSGEEGNGNGTGDFEAWDPMYRGKVMGTIRDCLENIYQTNDAGDTSGWTNQHTVKATGSLDLGELVDGLSLDLAYLHYWFDEKPVADADDDIGDEINMKVIYDYTEDVQFAIDSAYFIPGEYYDTLHTTAAITGGGLTSGTADQTSVIRTSNDAAVSIVGSCRVTF